MTILKTTKLLATTAMLLSGTMLAAQAEDYTITVWAGGTGDTSNYRYDNIVLAADILEREAAIRGEELNITVETQAWSGWDDFKQAVTLAAEAGNAPNIIISGHEDIGPWSQSGLLRPVEDYVDFDAWPLNAIYSNLYDITSYDGVVWGIPQDAESRPFYYSRANLKAIGWTDADIEALPGRVASGEYTLYNMIEDAKKMQVLDKQAMTDMFQFFVDAADAGVVPATHLGSTWDAFHEAVANDQAGFWHAGTWTKSEWETKWGVEDFFGQMQYSLIPAGNENGKANTISHPLVYLLSNAGTDDDAAISAVLITIASEPRFNALHAVKSGKVALSDAEAQIPLFANDRWAGIATTQLLPHATAIPNDVEFGPYWTAMFKNLEASWTGTVSVEDAVNALEAEVTSALGDKIIVR